MLVDGKLTKRKLKKEMLFKDEDVCVCVRVCEREKWLEVENGVLDYEF